MPGLLTQITDAVGGLDLTQLAGGTAGQLSGLSDTLSSWQSGAPGDFGAALGGLGSLASPNLSLAGNLGSSLSGLLPALQGNVGTLVTALQGDVESLPQRLQASMLEAVQPVIDRVTSLQTLFNSDWSCGLIGAPSPAPAPAPAPAPSPAPSPSPSPAPAPAPASAAITPTQVAAAQALVATLPADLSLPSLLRWVHARVGSFRPGYFTLRSIPIVDDLRDPLDTLIRWEAADAGAVQAELQQTLATLTTLVRDGSGGAFTRALPPATVAAVPAAALGVAAEPFIVALEALATAVQAQDLAQLGPRLATAQAARAALLTSNAAVTAAAAQRAALVTALGALPGQLDAGLCRLLVLLQPHPTFADLTDAIGGLAVPEIPADVLAPVEAAIQQARDTLVGLLDALDFSAVTGPLTDALGSANQAVDAVEQGLAQLSAEALRALGEARTAVEAIDLEALREQAEQALEDATTQLRELITQPLSSAASALGEAMTALRDAIDAIDPEALTEPIREAIQALGDLIQQEAVQRLTQILQQLEALALTIAELSFAPVADEVIAAVEDLKQIIQDIDIASLPDPGPALISGAMALLPQSLTPLTDPLIANLDQQLAGAPTQLLEQVKALPDLARDKLLAFSPRNALAPLLSAPFNQALGQLEAFEPTQWLSVADEALAGVRQQLARQIDIAALLAEAAQAHAAVLAELERFRPSTLLQPLEATLENALQAVATALPVGDLAATLEAVLGRITGFSQTMTAALDVADDLAGKLAGLGDAPAEFDTWVDDILVKVPASASGALAAALTDLRLAARAARPAQLTTDWASARQPLANALAGALATPRLTRLTMARGRIQSGLAALPSGQAAPISAWLTEAATQSAGEGLTALAALDRALSAADTALQTQFTQLAERYPDDDGPLAALLPAAADTLRAWVREALVRQFGQPVTTLLASLGPLAAVLQGALAALRDLATALQDKLDQLLAAPQALSDLLGDIAAVQQRLADLDLGIYTREVDEIYNALLDQVRATDPRTLQQPLEQARDQLLGLISLEGLLPAELRDQLREAHRQLLEKLRALDPDALLLQPLDAEYRELVEPLVAALDVGDSIDIIIVWLNGLPEDLQAQIARVDLPYSQLLQSAGGGGGGAGGSAGIGL